MVQPNRPHMTVQCCTEKVRFACWITKPRIQTPIHSVWYLLLFLANNGYINVCLYYVTYTSPILSSVHYITWCIYNLKSQQDPKTHFTVAVLTV
jgi:hypothetical protein